MNPKGAKTMLSLSQTLARPAVHRTNRTGVPHPLAVGISDHQPYIHISTKEFVGRRSERMSLRMREKPDLRKGRDIPPRHARIPIPGASRRTKPPYSALYLITHSFAMGTFDHAPDLQNILKPKALSSPFHCIPPPKTTPKRC